MDLQSLSAFLAITEAGSISGAARRLHLSQPAISKRLSGLESRLGHRLFDRIGRRVQLTPAGAQLRPHAERVLQDLEDGRRAMSHLSDRVAGRLSIGTSHHIGLHRLPSVLKAYTHAHPDVDLDLHFMDSEVACRAIVAGQLELGIVTLPTEPIPELEMRKIWNDPLAVVVSARHPLARKRRVLLAQLADLPALLPDEATYTHRIVTAELARHGVVPRVRLATNYLETLKMLVSIGLGWSVLPRTMLDRSLRALNTPGFAPKRALGMVWHRRRTLSAPAQQLIARLEAE